MYCRNGVPQERATRPAEAHGHEKVCLKDTEFSFLLHVQVTLQQMTFSFVGPNSGPDGTIRMATRAFKQGVC